MFLLDLGNKGKGPYQRGGCLVVAVNKSNI